MLDKCCIDGVIEAGCDEAGRGPLAGSVFAAAVAWSKEVLDNPAHEEWLELLDDSKKLTDKQRAYLRPLIEKYATAWAVVEVSAEEIDQINILQASITGMQRALDKLTITPQHILVDGNKWRPYIPEGQVMEIPATTVVKGDSKYMSIAAASIVAKVTRDRMMVEFHKLYPEYDFAGNKGYGSATHIDALKKLGPTPIHRQSFIKNFV